MPLAPAIIARTSFSWPGTSIRLRRRVASVERSEAELDRDAAAALLGQPVGLAAGQRAHQGRLAVIDVAGGADRERHRAHSGERLPHRPPCLLGLGVTHRPRVEHDPLAGDPADHRQRAATQALEQPLGAGLAGVDDADRARELDPGQRAAARGARVALDGRRLTDRACEPARPRRQLLLVGPRSSPAPAPPRRRLRGGRGAFASSAASCSLSRRIARASGWRRQRSTASRAPGEDAGLRPAEQLVAGAADDLRAGRDRGRCTVGSPRTGSRRARAEVVDHRDAALAGEAGQLSRTRAAR